MLRPPASGPSGGDHKHGVRARVQRGIDGGADALPPKQGQDLRQNSRCSAARRGKRDAAAGFFEVHRVLRAPPPRPPPYTPALPRSAPSGRLSARAPAQASRVVDATPIPPCDKALGQAFAHSPQPCILASQPFSHFGLTFRGLWHHCTSAGSLEEYGGADARPVVGAHALDVRDPSMSGSLPQEGGATKRPPAFSLARPAGTRCLVVDAGDEPFCSLRSTPQSGGSSRSPDDEVRYLGSRVVLAFPAPEVHDVRLT